MSVSEQNVPEESELPPPVEDSVLNCVQLGDAVADDRRLLDGLIDLSERLNDEAPGTSGHWALEALKGARWLLPKAWSCAVTVFHWAVKHFGENEKIILARAEAEKTVILAKADAMKKEAEAKQIDGLTAVAIAKGLAEVDDARVMTEWKREALKKLRARSMDWTTEIDENGIMQVGVTKKKAITDQSKDDG